MTLKKRFGIEALFLAMLLVIVSFVPAVSEQENTTENATLTFGPGTLDELKNNPDFIAAYGSIPAFRTLEEREQWLDTLENVYQDVIPKMSEYMYPKGPVTAYGYTIDGVFR